MNDMNIKNKLKFLEQKNKLLIQMVKNIKKIDKEIVFDLVNKFKNS
ncbi:hypothetical protein AshY1_04070 [Candidatus Phytoplasma fraxini]|uniref:Uncharacterized protein n=1 Tax=Ash yellows phytoplasma TaxID=35780 RepID=A0ABZ2UDQ6_ASHYP